jgi:hypothetical protein
VVYILMVAMVVHFLSGDTAVRAVHK